MSGIPLGRSAAQWRQQGRVRRRQAAETARAACFPFSHSSAGTAAVGRNSRRLRLPGVDVSAHGRSTRKLRRMEHSSHSPGRRAFLRGRSGRNTIPVRLPWIAIDRFVEDCTRCGACLTACPESIIVSSGGGFPGIDFSRGECTFCGACADACPESLFDRTCAEPWKLRANISGDCLAMRRILCRSCEDACPQDAIAFEAAPGRLPSPEINTAECTGCGACVSSCPENAISVQ